MIAVTTKEWLKRARIIDREIKQLKIAKQEAYDIAVSATIDTTKERVQSSSGNAMEKKYVALLEYDKSITEQESKLLKCKTEILDAINSVNNDLYRTLLTAYYINCKSWEEVALELHYDLRWVYRLHGRALHAIESHYKRMI